MLLAWLGVISLAWNLIALVLKLFLRGPVARRVGRAGIAYGYRFYWACARASGLMRLEAESLDALRDVPGGLIVAANHPSLLDALMMVARLPRSACIMKGALLRNPFLGAGAGWPATSVNDSTRTMMPRRRWNGWTTAASWWCSRKARAPVPGQIHPFSRSIALIALRAQGAGPDRVHRDRLALPGARAGRCWSCRRCRSCSAPAWASASSRGRCRAAAARMEEYFRQELRDSDAPSRTHLVVIPSYNTGPQGLRDRARRARQWAPVWVVVDGSDDGTAGGLQRMAASDPQLR